MTFQIVHSSDVLENSCEPELCEKVLEKMLGILDIEMGGPTFFYLMIWVIISTTEDAVHSLMKWVTKMKLTNYHGENVDTTTSHLHGALIPLKVVRKVPEDIVENLIEVFQTTYFCQWFQWHFQGFENQHEAGCKCGKTWSGGNYKDCQNELLRDERRWAMDWW